MLRLLTVSAFALAGSSVVAIADDLVAGQKLFRRCIACHAVGEKAKHRLGPVLNGLEGRAAGTIEGYNYSEANKESTIVWDEATFVEFIRSPRKNMPGTKMIFVGVRKEQDARALWQYLIQYGPDGQKKS